MSHRRWICHNPDCPARHGAVLGRVTDDGSLVLEPGAGFRIYMDTRRAHVVCPVCGTEREFRGAAVFSGRS
jgi:hypothetical protein